ncbi:MAG: hypothetical protein GXP11_10505 [Gammaproteobacteria bacterium]|nr:hypothetical protein [Gammaproteobacteria bacterium]
MKEHWYETEYEKDEKGDTCCGPTVLYTSQKGLEALTSELQRISEQKQMGRHELSINEVDNEHYAPFTHIEIAEKPPEDESSEWSWKLFIWIGIIILLVSILAIYGLVSIIIDIFK